MTNPVEQLAAITGETGLSADQVRRWFNDHYPPDYAWQPNVADLIAELVQEMDQRARRRQWRKKQEG